MINHGRVGIGPTGQTPVAVFSHSRQCWLLWLNYNSRMSAGTYLELRQDASVWRLTEDEDGVVSSVSEIKPSDPPEMFVTNILNPQPQAAKTRRSKR